MHVESGVTASDLRSFERQVEANRPRDANVFGRIGGAYGTGERGSGDGRDKGSAVHRFHPLQSAGLEIRTKAMSIVYVPDALTEAMMVVGAMGMCQFETHQTSQSRVFCQRTNDGLTEPECQRGSSKFHASTRARTAGAIVMS